MTHNIHNSKVYEARNASWFFWGEGGFTGGPIAMMFHYNCVFYIMWSELTSIMKISGRVAQTLIDNRQNVTLFHINPNQSIFFIKLHHKNNEIHL